MGSLGGTATSRVRLRAAGLLLALRDGFLKQLIERYADRETGAVMAVGSKFHSAKKIKLKAIKLLKYIR